MVIRSVFVGPNPLEFAFFNRPARAIVAIVLCSIVDVLRESVTASICVRGTAGTNANSYCDWPRGYVFVCVCPPSKGGITT